jgi:hypothetical protein
MEKVKAITFPRSAGYCSLIRGKLLTIANSKKKRGRERAISARGRETLSWGISAKKRAIPQVPINSLRGLIFRFPKNYFF